MNPLRVRLGRAVFLLALGVLPASLAQARTWEVAADTTNPGQRITNALLNAQVGDRIHISAGSYDGPPGGWRVTKPLEIYGDGPGWPFAGSHATGTWMRPAGPGDPVVWIDLGAYPSRGSSFENLYLHDLTIGPSAEPAAPNPRSQGVVVRPLDKYLVSLHFARVAVYHMGDDGFHLEGSWNNRAGYKIERLTLDDCKSLYNWGDGLEILRANGPRVTGGIYAHNKKRGVAFISCEEARIDNADIESNQRSAASATEAQLYLETAIGFSVTGCHFENFAGQDSESRGTSRRLAMGVTASKGGYIGANTFGLSSRVRGSRGIYLWYGDDTGIVIAPNVWGFVETLVEVQDSPTITSCIVMPQTVTDVDSSKVLVPETAGRGHVILPTTTNTSNVAAGIVLPKLSEASRKGMSPPARGGTQREGLVIYNSDRRQLQHWNGTRWMEEVPSIVDASRDTTVTSGSGIRPTSLLTSPPPGLYRVSVYAATKGALSADQAIQLRWTDDSGASHGTGWTLKSAAGSFVQESVPIYIGGGNLMLETSGIVGTGGSFSLRVRVEVLQ